MKTLTHISIDDYLLQESQAEYKSEYHAGEIVAMAGAREPHNAIVSNLIILLGQCLWKGKCRVYPSDLLISLPECEKFVYADVSIVCEKVALGEQRYGIDVLLNPTVVIEVLSESTELYDRVEKFACYKTLKSMQQYVLVDSRKVLIETFTRTAENDWLLKSISDKGKKVKIGECEILVEDIYHHVVFEKEENISQK
ncbi:Uma2 family endonuclease [Thermoflexibacter ruber]|uniref:Endonuclease, Uma2 family (Restriction endonuclease fold) n=1 Tax=Thermoflexibacter ruber TaxID=1003 RepID=A0A1I2HE97_9BACT|nr:Uma2 family endonuclease [Thermoflexibacter ruber]SFF28494.1 Endonuclease, Uma2 family (restriction endonuclease fold) [Thermoflexibacter ruber]